MTNEVKKQDVKVATVDEAVAEEQTELNKAKVLEDKTDEELAAAQDALAKALDAIPEAAEGVLASAREAVAADLNLVQEEIASRAGQTAAVIVQTADTFWDKYGSKINEGAKWAVLAAIVYRLFFF